MITLLSKYCDEFAKGFSPLLQPLRLASKALLKAPDDVPGRAIRPELSDLTQQVELLSKKIEDQQAYVVIFGPLKSGKSTLMNAICASYVSEVTSLPAYPCMVYVSHDPVMHYVLTRYDGESFEFHDDAKLHAEIGHAHTMLADKIREVEARGETFDPAVHFPTAIRRIDVKVPAGDLEESAAVLVDTPGLYSRMKFGYDQMTKDFRNAAACAIFVVKSDNLFLEQAFAEFHQLLDLFSRVFLVVNLDLGKRDLLPDGTLAPSLESEDPDSIIDAFKTLSMSNPLRKAFEDGRLQIFPAGLLEAASQRLRAQQGARIPEDSRETGFEAFRSAFTEYLNSPDYMVAFLGDSLRHAGTLLSECRSLMSRDAVRELKRGVATLDEQKASIAAKVAANDKLRAHDWRGQYQQVAQELSDEFKQRVRAVESKAASATDGALEAWFNDNASLADLNEKRFAPVFRAYQDELAMTLEESLRERIRVGDGGLPGAGATAEERALLGLDLDSIGRRAIEGLDRSRLVQDPKSIVRGAAVPIRRGVVDWLLLRPAARLRSKILGDVDRPTAPLTPEIKRKRLGPRAQRMMHEALADYRKSFLSETFKRQRAEILGAHARRCLESIAKRLSTQSEELRATMQETEQKLAQRRGILDPLLALEAELAKSGSVIDTLSKEYTQKSPEDLLGPVLEPAPRRSNAKPAADAKPAPDATKGPAADKAAATSAKSESAEKADKKDA